MPSMEDAMKRAGLQSKHQGRRDRGRGDRGRPSSSDLPRFPDKYFGRDDSGRRYLQAEFVSKRNVDPWAKHLARNSRPNLTTGQIRRFFNHCREIERRLNVDGQSWAQVSASFESLCFHAQNARWAKKIPEEFQSFIDDNVRRVTSAQDPGKAFVDGFVPHFEALVGFGAAYMKKDS